ncbi:uncharacterized protein LOC127247656 isoform X3 [Andrographis paniculata]|uniref:uncharacterized protein LOC127247656 isoform X3 n=1 Tax=Andrographis paniculata TaxID=175694 RepID=UPI0021E6D991|nr:uncharacterized protein LOC127247656 isoform X3 [Andrographis paniculata]
MASLDFWISFRCKSKESLTPQSRFATVRSKRTTCVDFSRRKPTIKSMRAVVQRVASASVEVDGRTVSAIGPGLLVLIGLHENDVDSDAEYICRKVLNMRLFPNEKTGRNWDQSVMQKNYEVLLVSQFTLYGILKGNKPDFHVAMPPNTAKSFYTSLVENFRKSYRTDAIKDILGSELGFGSCIGVHVLGRHEIIEA